VFSKAEATVRNAEQIAPLITKWYLGPLGWANLLAGRNRASRRIIVKKSMLSLAAILVLFASTLTASAQFHATPQAMSGSNPRPQAMSGSNPRPQAMSGSNPRPQSFLGGMYSTVLAYFGF
jgi:hypothetical protein